jgi:hypothetical protein
MSDALTHAWLSAMQRGDFAAAWRVSDSVLAQRPPGATCWDRPRHEQWVWSGADLAGKRVLVRCYHGLGDTLQFSRFLPRLHDIAHSVTVWAQPVLIPVLKTMGDIGALLPVHDGDPGVPFDVDIEIMELAHAFRVQVDDLAANVPYLHVPPAPRGREGYSIGVLLEAGGWDDRRSIDPRLFRMPPCEVTGFSLQLGKPLPGMRDLSTSDVVELAQRIQSLDLVITVDTMLAHLAGALGVPTWVLLRTPADWRWMTDRRDSPWYPSLRLFRQPAPGDWTSVVGEVEAALKGLVSGREVLACAR